MLNKPTMPPRNLEGHGPAPALHEQCASIRRFLARSELYQDPTSQGSTAPEASGDMVTWRISPTPFFLTADEARFFDDLGTHLLAFYRALNRLYLDSARGLQPAWAHAYLDQGKPEHLVTYGRMNRFRNLLPGVIRPDVIPTDEGMVITELDSVPGGIGVTDCLAQAYAQACGTEVSASLVGGLDGMMHGFARMLSSNRGTESGCIAIVVSDESRSYRPEMAWMATRLQEHGLETTCVHPRNLRFTEESLLVPGPDGFRPVSVLYRFFELFDLPNVPKAELMQYSAKKERVSITPPFKPWLEEKLAFALLHHPVLESFWTRALGEETFERLTGLIPRTWILDPRPVPPMGIIPDLRIGGQAVADWKRIADATQKERRYVVKPSGFSDLAWGSRGVSMGHDLPQSEWRDVLQRALTSFDQSPHILQAFHKGRQVRGAYEDPRTQEILPMDGRVRLSPYYFVDGEKAVLSGILATLCPLDKKVIHGMRDAILMPCAVSATVGRERPHTVPR